MTSIHTDDGDFISDEFLASMGGKPCPVSDAYEFKTLDGSLLMLWGYEGNESYMVTLTAHPELEAEGPNDVSREITLPELAKRWEFRRLCYALGVKLPLGITLLCDGRIVNM